MLEVGDKDLFQYCVFICPLISSSLRLTTKSSMHRFPVSDHLLGGLTVQFNPTHDCSTLPSQATDTCAAIGVKRFKFSVIVSTVPNNP
jgi:hypothetical protein